MQFYICKVIIVGHTCWVWVGLDSRISTHFCHCSCIVRVNYVSSIQFYDYIMYAFWDLLIFLQNCNMIKCTDEHFNIRYIIFLTSYFIWCNLSIPAKALFWFSCPCTISFLISPRNSRGNKILLTLLGIKCTCSSNKGPCLFPKGDKREIV